jgi:hypothetical protein
MLDFAFQTQVAQIKVSGLCYGHTTGAGIVDAAKSLDPPNFVYCNDCGVDRRLGS